MTSLVKVSLSEKEEELPLEDSLPFPEFEAELEASKDVSKDEKGKYKFVGILSPQERQALRFVACGYSPGEVVKNLEGLTINRLRALMQTDLGETYINKIQSLLDADFKNLYLEVITVIAKGLKYPDPAIRLASANLWSKMSGKVKQTTILESAEDVIRGIVENSEKKEE